MPKKKGGPPPAKPAAKKKSKNGKGKSKPKTSSKPRGNSAGASQLDPKLNDKFRRNLISGYTFAPVNPLLEVACKRKITVSGKYLKLDGPKEKAEFKFQVIKHCVSAEFKERGGSTRIVPAFKLVDVTDYSSPQIVALFGEDEDPWSNIKIPVSPEYQQLRHKTWDSNSSERTLGRPMHQAQDMSVPLAWPAM